PVSHSDSKGAVTVHLLHNTHKEMASQVRSIILLAHIFWLAEEKTGRVAAVADLAKLFEPFRAEPVIIPFGLDRIQSGTVSADNRGHVVDPLHPPFDLER